VTYNQPITVVAAQTIPESTEAEEQQAAKSESFINTALSEFKQQNFLGALESVNKAIAESPGDGAFHEFRALVLFALGKYPEAAGVLNPILVSSPGWDWSTMIQFYGSPDTYTEQLRKLEEYSVANSESAPVQFLLGYHYMIGTHLEAASAAFAKAAELEPADRVASQLAELAASSTTTGEETDLAGEEATPMTDPKEILELDQILGSWKADNGENGVVTLMLSAEGGFTWKFEGGEGEPFEMQGEFNLGQSNLLTLDANESQMVGTVSISPEGGLNFVLAGGPPGDPGLQFDKG
jgi:tetratricopeptide (TPR) repeat protein